MFRAYLYSTRSSLAEAKGPAAIIGAPDLRSRGRLQRSFDSQPSHAWNTTFFLHGPPPSGPAALAVNGALGISRDFRSIRTAAMRTIYFLTESPTWVVSIAETSSNQGRERLGILSPYVSCEWLRSSKCDLRYSCNRALERRLESDTLLTRAHTSLRLTWRAEAWSRRVMPESRKRFPERAHMPVSRSCDNWTSDTGRCRAH
ncbi:hypothetical protein B0H15DRAFT_1025939 [Mycena belliarum]|uniref:Uncharacterized protein n=1 Tax=Mycena belliarum TaxID=1033014 RepID=A0AAD6TSI2_9AGAR|nr:hypothetical protein B0H15DRAFT_1025939 [Mycena belliae]